MHANYQSCFSLVRYIWVPCFNLSELSRGNNEYIDKLYARLSHQLNHTWLCMYPCPRKVLLVNGSKFKRYFTPLLKVFSITPICASINNLHSNSQVERINQVIYSMIVIKYLDRKVYEYIYPWGGTLALIVWEIIAPYYCTLGFTPVQAAFRGICYSTSRQSLIVVL